MLNKQFFSYQNETYGDDGLSSAISAGSILAVSDAQQNEDFLPEKYQVLKEDGSVDLEKSARKLSEGYSHLERRLGTGDVPPHSAGEYEVDLNSDHYSFEEFKQEPENLEFLNKAHSLGMTQKQVEFVLSEYANRLPELVQVGKELDIEGAHQALSEVWQNEGEFNRNLQSAYQAFQRYAAPEDLQHMDQIGNNPIVIKMLANIGKAFQEDIGISRASGFQQPPTQLKQGDDCLDGKSIKKDILDISQTNKQVFFCKKPFIVEGRPDQIICEVLADKVQVALEPVGVQTLVLTGVNKILPTYQLLSLLNKTPIMLVDADAVADGTSLIDAILDKNEEAIKSYDAKSGQAPIRARILELYTEFDQKNHDKLLKDLIQQTVIYPCYNYHSEIYENGLNDEDQEDKEILFRKRLGFCLLFNVPTLSIEDKALKLRFETMLEELEKFGLFVLKKGSIESYYQKTELRKDGASKIDEAIIEADYIIEEMELSQITKNYPEIINCLKYSTFITPICECNLVKEWLRTICFTLQSALVEKKTQDYQAKIFDLIGDKAKLFIVHATEAALTIDINSTILDVAGFPIEITHEDDANEIDKKIEQIKARGSQ